MDSTRLSDRFARALRDVPRGSAPAFALDAFRIAAGLVCFAAFVRNLLEVPLFAAPDGLIDHAIAHSIAASRNPFQGLTLLPPDASVGWVAGLYAIGAGCALAITLGVHVRIAALLMWAIGVSAFRFNYLVANVDDYAMNVVMFWLAMLPLGHTLRATDLLGATRARRRELVEGWLDVRVSSFALRAFLVNIALIYVVAGMLKWTSPFWKEGFALFAVLKMPIAYQPELFAANHWLLQIGTYATLALEPAAPLVMLLPLGSRLKLVLGMAIVGLHLGIVATMKIPYINLALIGVCILYFREEITAGVRIWMRARPSEKPGPVVLDRGVRGVALGAIALTTVHLLGGPLGVPARVRVHTGRMLQMVGLQQGYALFNWIDARANAVHVYATIAPLEPGVDPVDARVEPRTTGERLDVDRLWPSSMRADLMVSYMIGHDWHRLRPNEREPFLGAVRERVAARFCRAHAEPVEVRASADVVPTRKDGLEAVARTVPLVHFRCNAEGESRVLAGLEWLEPASTRAESSLTVRR